jgi:diacylglycerol kinase family enzyme
MRKWTLACKFPLVYVGLHTRASGIEAFRCERILLEGEAGLEIDGDYFGQVTEVELRIAKEKLTVAGLPP